MALSTEEIKELKSQLSSQIQHLPADQKAEAQKEIDTLSPEALESMLKQQTSKSSKQQSNKGIFRMIVDKDIESKIIIETKDSLAVLDIRPISKGHTIIIPKKAISDTKYLPVSIFTLAKKIAKRMISKLSAINCEIQTEYKFGEIILNVIPIYKESLNLSSKRYEASPAELSEVQNKLAIKIKPTVKKIVIEKKPTSNLIQLKRRIP